jgi:hypothetical protein
MIKYLKLTIDNRYKEKRAYEKIIGKTIFDKELYVRKVYVFDSATHKYEWEKVILKQTDRFKNIIYVVAI